MVARIGAWVELGFWHTVVRVLTTVRPVSHAWSEARHTVENKPVLQFMPKGWMIAVCGWALGILAGIAIVFWWA